MNVTTVAPVETAKPGPGFVRSEDLTPVRRWVGFGFVFIAYFFYSWSWNTVDVLRPYIRDSLGLSMEQAGSLYSVQAIGALVGAFINGQLADRFGRRNALAVVMVAYGLTLFSGVFATEYWQVLIQRFVLGYFTGSMFPIAVGIYTGLFDAKVRGRIAALIFAGYNAGVSLLGLTAAFLFSRNFDWELLFWAGLIPVALAGLAFVALPDDRKLIPFGGAVAKPADAARFPVSELFRRDVRVQTLLLATMTGLNFFAYQAFTGWATTFLRDERGFSGEAIGLAIGWQFAGALVGGFCWGWVGDRFGRRIPAYGFIAAAALVLVYIFAPISVPVLVSVGFAYGFLHSANVIWGPWLAELYPPHLKSTAASIFNWGRVVSFMAPVVTASVAGSFGLPVAMALASISFTVAGIIWLALPETLSRKLAKSAEGAR